jgi:hypothetical protein
VLEPLPLLFLDVDGVVLPIGAELEDLGTALGRQLAALHCELVWATAWQHDANEEIAPRIGLPRLPVVEWRDTTVAEDDEDTYLGLHWKTRLLVEWAAGRDFAWVDDEVTDTDANWIAEHHPGRAMVHRVRSPGGLSPADFAVVGRWLRGVRGGVGGS